MFNTSELDELFQILISIKGIKLRQPQGSNTTLHRSGNIKFERKVFHPSLLPVDFICMDLIGEFHPPTSRGHCYALTVYCMLTGFTWCIPLKTKTAEEVAEAYLDHFYSLFGGSVKILMNNGTEFSSGKLSPN